MIKYSLKNCVWEVTLSCCFSCRHCGSRAGAARDNELSTEECLNVVKQLAELGCRRVSLIGGEVFMRSDWDVIAKSLTDHSISTSVITNGYDFDGAVINKLKEVCIESVAVSVDGNEEIHDYMRQKGSYSRALRAVDNLNSACIPVSIITTLNSTNIRCLEEIYSVLSQKDILAWQLQACSPMGNAVKTGIDYRFDHMHAIRFVEKHLFDAPFVIGVADNIGYFSDSEGILRGNTNERAYYRGCSAGLASIGIDSIGNVRGCDSMYADAFIEGNLREKSLKTIWNDPGAFQYNREFTADLLTGICNECEYGSICAGGCRSYNYFTCGDLYSHEDCVKKR